MQNDLDYKKAIPVKKATPSAAAAMNKQTGEKPQPLNMDGDDLTDVNLNFIEFLKQKPMKESDMKF